MQRQRLTDRVCCRVDGIPNPQFSKPGHGLSLADMAAAAVAGSQEGRLGTGIYLLASLFNHSCIPNVDVTFPFNNSELFTLCCAFACDCLEVWWLALQLHCSRTDGKDFDLVHLLERGTGHGALGLA